jgi:hypothetical protein
MHCEGFTENKTEFLLKQCSHEKNKTDLFSAITLLPDRFAETKRYMDFINPGSQAEEGTFIGLEAALVGSQPG